MNTLSHSIKKDLVFLDLDFLNQKETIKFLADKLLEKGLVKESFLEGVLEREKKFPTGLFLEKHNVAIPHCDTCHVNESAIVVARLKNEINFKYMADPSKDVKVKLVIMLAIKDPKSQVPVLSDLMTKLSNGDLVEKMMLAKDCDDFIKLMIEERG